MADGTLELVPESLADDANDDRVLPMTDVFTTAYHAVLGADISEGDTVLVVGDGAVGLLACHAARLFTPAAIVLAGHHDDRLEVGRRLGATHAVNTSANGGLAELIGGLTDEHGPHAVVDAVSSTASMKLSTEIVQAGGTVSWVGMEVFLGAPDALVGPVLHAQPHDPRRGRAGEALPPRVVAPPRGGHIDPSPVLTQDLAWRRRPLSGPTGPWRDASRAP